MSAFEQPTLHSFAADRRQEAREAVGLAIELLGGLRGCFEALARDEEEAVIAGLEAMLDIEPRIPEDFVARLERLRDGLA